jgi:hypothetical protein
MIALIKERLKGAWKSITIWVNGILAGLVVMWPDIQAALANTDFEPYVGAVAARWVMLAIVVLNIIIRFRTTKGLEQK